MAATQSFIGRHDELTALSEAFLRASRGHTTLVAVAGDTGIGKSRLVSEFLARFSDQAAGSGVGHCLDHVHVPFLPFSDVFAGLGLDSSNMGTLPAPTLSRRRQIEWQEQRFRDLAQLLVGAPSPKPYVVVIEDLQSADAATLGLLEHMAVSRTAGALLVIVTVRTDTPDRSVKFARTMNRLHAAGLLTIRIQPLERVQMMQLIRSASKTLTRSVVERIESLAEGNPLIAEELLRGSIDSGLALPTHPSFQSVRTSVLERLYGLQEDDQRVLTTAAVIGSLFDARLLATLLGRRLSDVLAALRRARNVQLIREFAQSSGLVGFRHAVYRDVIYRELLAIESQELHRCAALALEAEDPPDRHAVELAYHWTAAGEAQRAFPYHVQAADAAMTLAAFEDAARAYDVAIQSVEKTSPAYAELAEKRAHAWYAAGVGESTSQYFADALDAYKAIGATDKVIAMLLFLSRQAWNDAASPAGLAHALEAAQALDGAEHDREYAMTMAASYAVQLGDFAQAQHLLESAGVSAHEQIGARQLDTSAAIAWHRGDAASALEISAASRAIADRLAEPDLLVRVYSNRADMLDRFGQLIDGLEHWRLAYNAAQAGGFVGRMAYAALGYAAALADCGELDRARHLYMLAVATGTTNASVSMLSGSVGALLRALLDERIPLVISADESLSLALQSREPLRIAQITSSLALAALFEDRASDADGLLQQGLDALTSLTFAEPLLLLAALYASGDARVRARNELEALASTPSTKLARVFHDAAIASARRGTARADALRRVAGIAGEQQRRLHQVLFTWNAGDLGDADVLLEAMGATRAAKEIREHSSRQRLRPSSLTRRELEVARLLTHQQSNRAIAQQLNISERTVEHHVESILAQTGVRSRFLVTQELLSNCT